MRAHDSGGRARRIWCEQLDPQLVQSERILGPLRERDIQLVLAIRPGRVEPAVGVVAVARAMGVSVAVWPMLADHDGRWVSARNVHRYVDFVEHVLTRLELGGALPDELAMDLEPPIADVRALLRGDLRPLLHAWGRPEVAVRDPWERLFAQLQRRGVRPWAAVVPLVLADRPGRLGWQRLLCTRVDAAAFECISPMVYTSITGGYARGLLQRPDLQALLWRSARACVRRYGSRAAASLGAVAPGALGDEAPYASPEELADDVAIVRAAGIDDLALFDLGGVVQRGPIEPWLDAFVRTAPASQPPPNTLRARAVERLAVMVSRVAGG
jgi:hypothetical protein